MICTMQKFPVISKKRAKDANAKRKMGPFLILHFAFCILHSKKAALCCERRPYTHPSGFTTPRSFGFLLRTGNLAAHVVYRLMLLDPSPDMVHGSALRKTHSSTQEKELNSEKIGSQEGNPPLL